MSYSHKNNALFSRAHFVVALLVLLIGTLVSPLYASSTIFDGVIEDVYEKEIKKTHRDKDGKRVRVFSKQVMLKLKALYSPYSSPTPHAAMQKNVHGNVKMYITQPLNAFDVFYIDDIPVTQEEIAPLLIKGARISTFENQSSWYFLRVVTRAHHHKVGYMTQLEGNELTLARPQMGTKHQSYWALSGSTRAADADGVINLNYSYYPWLETKIVLDDNAVVKSGNQSGSWKNANLSQWVKRVEYPDVSDLRQAFIDSVDMKAKGEKTNPQITTEIKKRMSSLMKGRTAILVQAPRPHARVEILPAGFGDWQSLVSERNTKRPWKAEKNQLRGQFFGLMLPGNPVKKKLDTRDYFRMTDTPDLRETKAFASYLLAGGPEEAAPVWRGIYSKQHYMMDGYFVDDDSLNISPYTPGRFFVGHVRRGRSVSDIIATESEAAVAWGTISSVEGEEVKLESPEIEGVPVSGKQTYKIPADAEYYYLGKKLSEEEKQKMFKQGTLIRVYPARPQTILINERR